MGYEFVISPTFSRLQRIQFAFVVGFYESHGYHEHCTIFYRNSFVWLMHSNNALECVAAQFMRPKFRWGMEAEEMINFN